jgi:hypothetical protein
MKTSNRNEAEAISLEIVAERRGWLECDTEGAQYGNTDETELHKLTEWNDKSSKGYP